MFDDDPMNDTTSTQTEQSVAPPAAPPLVRPREDRVIAGVAAGIANRLGIGTGWVRAAFVISSFFGGAGLLLYIVGWLAIPEEGEGESIAAAKVADLEGSSRWIGIALIVAGGLLVLSWTDAVRGELVWAGALVLAGILLYRGEFPTVSRSHSPAPLPPAPAPPPPTTATDAPVDDTVDDEEVADAFVSDPLPPDAPQPPPPPPVPGAPRDRRKRSMLGRFTLATMLVAVGVIALLDNAGVVEPAARHYVGAVVGVAGLGLIVGSWVGRSRGLIAVGILLLPVLLVASVVRVPFSNDFGEKVFRPNSLASVADDYRLGAGDLHLDLRRIDLSESPLDVEATVGAGRLTVIVPADTVVSVDSRVGFGELEVFGTVRSGVGREIKLYAPADATNVINLDVEVGFGQLVVVRAFR
jgi:phage shock protein PspC (stress-responsive transcriptional regulator)